MYEYVREILNFSRGYDLKIYVIVGVIAGVVVVVIIILLDVVKTLFNI